MDEAAHARLNAKSRRDEWNAAAILSLLPNTGHFAVSLGGVTIEHRGAN
jgi:hypothetical protein